MSGNTTKKLGSIGFALLVVLSVFATGGAMGAYEGNDTVTHWVIDSQSELQNTESSMDMSVSSDGLATLNGGSARYSLDSSNLADADTLTVHITSANDTSSVVGELMLEDSAKDVVTSVQIDGTGDYSIDLTDVSITDGETYTAQIGVGDDITYDYLALTSQNTAPSADAGADQTVNTGDNVTFDGSASSDPNGENITYSWDFDGDGTEDATGASPVHSFASAGTYDVDLTVSDGSLSATDTVTVTVEETSTTTPTETTTEEPATNNVTFNVENNSTAVENASVVVTDDNGTEVASLSSDSNGSAVASLEDGNYPFVVSADGYDDASGDVTVDGDAQSVSVDFANEDGGAVIIDDGSSSTISVEQIVGGVLVGIIVTFILAIIAKVE